MKLAVSPVRSGEMAPSWLSSATFFEAAVEFDDFTEQARNIQEVFFYLKDAENFPTSFHHVFLLCNFF